MTNTLESASNLIVNTYPNPSGDQIMLEFKTVPKNIIAFNIFDLTGKVIYTSSQVKQQQSIFTNNWLSGIYMLYIQTTTQGNIYHRIIKS